MHVSLIVYSSLGNSCYRKQGDVKYFHLIV